MRNLFFILSFFLGMNIVAQASNDKIIDESQLPKAAKQFIKQHFGTKDISLVKMDSEMFDKSYDVIFADGTKLEFSSKGIWEKVESRQSVVPQALIPDAITKYITTKYPDTNVWSIEKKDRNITEVELSNGTELKFDKKFNLIDIDID